MDNNPYPVTITGVNLSSIAGNGSEYLLDAGLWTACRDSREVMKKKWKERTKIYVHNPDPTRRDLTPQMVGVICEGDKTYGFTVNPRTDLICLQIPEDAVYNDFDSRSKLPFWNDSWYGWRGPMNVAFEYDSSWAFDPKKETIDDLRKRPGPRACFLNLMIDSIADFEGIEDGTADYPFILVDRSIRKKPGCKRRYYDDEAFHAQGRTFEGVWNERDLIQESSTSSMNAVEFLDMLEAIPGTWGFYGFDDEAGREVRKNDDLWEWIDVEIKEFVSVFVCEATEPQVQGV
ncbi:hypothetical protein GQ607_010598 [Colletotrichum asianum]|uniref:Uncharacterized protein n=1 Tax=Colletotrichum asianum TaxID=702518 RepID=A0A8H3W970_9PEZI|nr:hypothetical protein GQ607_010598 [Colletotrichum asianum]